MTCFSPFLLSAIVRASFRSRFARGASRFRVRVRVLLRVGFARGGFHLFGLHARAGAQRASLELGAVEDERRLATGVDGVESHDGESAVVLPLVAAFSRFGGAVRTLKIAPPGHLHGRRGGREGAEETEETGPDVVGRREKVEVADVHEAMAAVLGLGGGGDGGGGRGHISGRTPDGRRRPRDGNAAEPRAGARRAEGRERALRYRRERRHRRRLCSRGRARASIPIRGRRHVDRIVGPSRRSFPGKTPFHRPRRKARSPHPPCPRRARRPSGARRCARTVRRTRDATRLSSRPRPGTDPAPRSSARASSASPSRRVCWMRISTSRCTTRTSRTPPRYRTAPAGSGSPTSSSPWIARPRGRPPPTASSSATSTETIPSCASVKSFSTTTEIRTVRPPSPSGHPRTSANSVPRSSPTSPACHRNLPGDGTSPRPSWRCRGTWRASDPTPSLAAPNSARRGSTSSRRRPRPTPPRTSSSTARGSETPRDTDDWREIRS